MANKITFEDKVTKNVSTEEDKYKITAKDVNEIKTVVNENTEEIETLKNNKSAMTAYLSANQAVSTQTSPFINLDAIQTSFGDDLELSGNAILCKRKGIIEVCGALEVGNLVVGGNVQPRIFSNKSNQVSSLLTRVSASNDQTFFIPTRILSVEANTPINLYIGNWSVNDLTVYGRNKATYLTVKYID